MPKSSRTGDLNSLAASIVARTTGEPTPTDLGEPEAGVDDPRAVDAFGDGTRGADIVILLQSGVEVRVPAKQVPGLAPFLHEWDLVRDVKTADDGERLHWPALGVEHTVPALLAAVLGLRTAHANGRRGGLKGGPARKAALSEEQRKASARKAAEARWGPRTADGEK